MPIFRSSHQAALLAWLLMHPAEEFSLTDLARRVGVPLTTAQREVQRLVDAQLLKDRTVGRSRLVRANATHRAIRPLTQLLEVTYGPQVVIEEEFQIAGAERVLIFGSWAARFAGEPGGPPHDIDVLVIGAVSRGDVYDAADRAQERLGIQVNPVIRSLEQWTTDVDALITQVKSSPTVDVTTGQAA
jgi:predicted nucleotidyltransferase